MPAVGFIECDARCVDSLGDNAHCGGCGNACGNNEQCIDGQCRTCPNAREQFCPLHWEGFACVNVQTDQSNCGECGHWCNGLGYECISGSCVCKPDTDRCVLEGVELCTDLLRDEDNCGMCGSRCAEGEDCANGTCMRP